MSRIRVVQWTTGKTGSAAVRAIAQQPGLELVGCYGYSPAKIGQDVGEICGVPSLGIPITNDIESLLSLHPDCVIYTPTGPTSIRLSTSWSQVSTL